MRYCTELTAAAEADLKAALVNSRKVEAIIRAVADRYKLAPLQVVGRGQTARVLEARMMAMALCAYFTTATHAQIGQRFMGRARASIARARRLHSERWTECPHYRLATNAVVRAVEAVR